MNSMSAVRCVLLAFALLGSALPAIGRGADPVTPDRRFTDTAGSVELGLEILAEEIVAKSLSADHPAIAVLPFPNADNTCSVLSNYLADELINALFSVSHGNLRIIERNQLMAVFNTEIELGESGLLNPATTRKVGSATGAQELVIGSVSQLGDRLRINARIISTENAFTVSAAAVTVPRTGDVETLLRQPVANENGVCGAQAVRGPASPPQGSASGGVVSIQPFNPKAASLEGITFTAQTVSRSSDKKTVSVVLSLVNQTDQPIQVALVFPRPSVIDDQASQADAEFVNGIQACWNTSNFCRANSSTFGWTILSPNLPTNLLLKFGSKDAEFAGSKLSMAASLLKAPAGKLTPDQIKDISISLANLPFAPGR